MSIKDTQAWKWFSIYIRQRDRGKCFTCQRVFPWKKVDAGHFRHRSLTTFFSERNVHAQCTGCNRFNHGNLGVYAVRLDEVYGSGTAKALILESNKSRQSYSKKEIKAIAEKYRSMVRGLQKSDEM